MPVEKFTTNMFSNFKKINGFDGPLSLEISIMMVIKDK